MTHSMRNISIEALAAAAILLVSAGCTDRTGAQSTPTAGHPCPPWVEFPADIHNNEESPYLGCVNAANLKVSVDNQNDLKQGRTLGPADGERESTAVGAYDQGKVKPFVATTGGATSTVVIPGVATGSSQ